MAPPIHSLVPRSGELLLALLVGCTGASACSDSSGGEARAEGQPDGAAQLPGEEGGPPTGDTWTGFAQGFFTTYCVQCHGAGNANRDYTLREQVARDTEKIRCGVAVEKQAGCGDWPPPSQFPIGGGPHPAEDERARLVAWLEAGAPE